MRDYQYEGKDKCHNCNGWGFIVDHTNCHPGQTRKKECWKCSGTGKRKVRR